MQRKQTTPWKWGLTAGSKGGAFLIKHGKDIKQSILEGKYTPQSVRRVEIPNPDGGVRLLGIPTVLDRMIRQQLGSGHRLRKIL